ncbi:MORN repeat-containing protein 5-like isoform X2 [Phytophthora palmivora]|uniref:MORN repeat-containing protein 5 n=1 Tax=Phytophthora palmivora TaxID=4796 RepID=A0A2P4Y6G4_9STRA|nr:MORN repeat-containing protein 5-like isoform X2 [Phytophthora palmivora]
MEYSQSKYEGSMEFGRYHGNGVLHLPDGYRYEGEFKNGEFHGHGTLFFPEGQLEGEWACGKQVEGTFTFSDGLEYAPAGWTYCTNANREYFSESVSPRGILPAGELNYFDTGVNRVVPLGSFDAGNGIYTPSTGLVSGYNDPSKTREPTEQEKEWIMKRAPKATTKDMSIN